MMRGKPANAMQKTYDDCYLVCSTAVYFESQNNEAEALRSWKNALDQIYYHNAYRVPANYRPRSETEKALQESLRQMELQCKERVDLLEAIRKSKLDAEKEMGDASGNHDISGVRAGKPLPTPPIGSRPTDIDGWLANGTVPPLGYPDLGRPPPLPLRPRIASRKRSSDSEGRAKNELQSEGLPAPTIGSSASVPKVKKTSRTPSPEKRSMLRTLRPLGKERTSSSSSFSKVNSREGSRTAVPAAKAATQAWGSRTSNISQGSSTNLVMSSAAAASAPVIGKAVEPAKRPEPNLLPYRNEYVTKSAPLVDTQEAIARARKKHGLSLQSESPILTPDHFSDTDQDSTPPYRNHRNRDSGGNKSESNTPNTSSPRVSRRPVPEPSASNRAGTARGDSSNQPGKAPFSSSEDLSSGSFDDAGRGRRNARASKEAPRHATSPSLPQSDGSSNASPADRQWRRRIAHLMAHLPDGIDPGAAKSVLNDVVVQGDVVHWDDVAGLEIAKAALKENVVYPFLRPDLFMGLREPARGMLLFGPPGTGKTMLARAVATESNSTFFSISASSLTSKWLGESEKLVRALFALAKELAPSIIFVDEIDSLLSSRGGQGEHESTRRIKTEFLIQWSDLARAAAGREQTEKEKIRGDASRVLVLAATNLPWAIDEAARRRFVRRQYIPLPEDHVRGRQIRRLLSHQKHSLSERDIDMLVQKTNGFSGSDITALAKDAAMGPLRSLGEKLLHMSMDDIRPMGLGDFLASLQTIRPSVGKEGLKEYEDWARNFGERGG